MSIEVLGYLWLHIISRSQIDLLWLISLIKFSRVIRVVYLHNYFFFFGDEPIIFTHFRIIRQLPTPLVYKKKNDELDVNFDKL